MIKLTIGLLFITASIGLSQSLHDDIKEIYDFSPGKLTRGAEYKDSANGRLLEQSQGRHSKVLTGT